MPSVPTAAPDDLPDLMSESEAIETRASLWQAGQAPSAEDINEVRASYRKWYARAKRRLSGEFLVQFQGEYRGSLFTPGIEKFLNAPLEESPFKDESGNFPLGRWQNPFQATFRQKIERQRQLLVDARTGDRDLEELVGSLGAVFSRLPVYFDTLHRRANAQVPETAITNEAGLQVAVEAVLRLLFEDVRTEDFVASSAGSNSRVDFLLPEVGVVIETKMTRPSLTAGRLGEELLVDAGRYPKRPDCRAILAFVYDPARHLANPKGIEKDLTRPTADGVPFVCVIAS